MKFTSKIKLALILVVMVLISCHQNHDNPDLYFNIYLAGFEDNKTDIDQKTFTNEIMGFAEFAIEYYKKEFDIHIQLNYEKKNEPNYDSKVFDLYYFLNETSDSGSSDINEQRIIIQCSPEGLATEVSKWILVHEIGHVFSALDVTTNNSIMSKDSHLTNVNDTGLETKTKKYLNDYYEFCDFNKKVINLAKESIRNDFKGFFLWDLSYADEIINLHNENTEVLRYPKYIDYILAVYYVKNNKKDESLYHINKVKKHLEEHGTLFQNTHFNIEEININEMNYLTAVVYEQEGDYQSAIKYYELIDESYHNFTAVQARLNFINSKIHNDN